MEEKKYLDFAGLQRYNEKLQAKMATDDAATLEAAKTYTDGKIGTLDTGVATVAAAILAEKNRATGVEEGLSTAIGTAKSGETHGTGLTGRVEDLEAAIGAGGSIMDTIQGEINKLDKDDAAVAGQFVTAVSETDGVITVSRAALAATDIPDITLAKVTDAGTAAAANVATVAIGTEGEATDALATVAQIKTYVSAEAYDDSALAGRVSTLEGKHAEGKTVAEEVTAGIEALDATVRGSLSDEDALSDNKHVGVKVVEEDGKLTSVTVVESFGTAADADVATTAIGTDGENTSALPTVAQVKKYVADEVADLEGATHFIGVKTELPATADNGDICIVGVKEYIYVENDGWKELGDETIYATKATTIAGVDLQDNITKDELLTALNVADGAQVNVIEKVQVNGADLTITNKTVNVTVTEGSTAGTIAVNGVDVTVKGVGDVDAKVKTVQDAVDVLNGDASKDGSVAKAVADEASRIDGIVGTPDTGKTIQDEIDAVEAAIGTAKSGETAGTGLTGRIETIEAELAGADTFTTITNNEIDSLFTTETE